MTSNETCLFSNTFFWKSVADKDQLSVSKSLHSNFSDKEGSFLDLIDFLFEKYVGSLLRTFVHTKKVNSGDLQVFTELTKMKPSENAKWFL